MLKKDNIADQNKVKGVLGNIIALILKKILAVNQSTSPVKSILQIIILKAVKRSKPCKPKSTSKQER